MGVSLYQTSLFNSDGGGGILEVDPRSPGTIGGLRNSPWDQAFSGSSASALYNFVGPMTFTDNSNSVSFTLTVDADNPASTPGAQNGVQTSYTIDRDTVDQWLPASNGVVANASQWAYLLDKVLSGTAGTGDYMGQYVIQTDETSARGSSYHLDSVSSTLSDGGTGGLLIDGLGTIYGQRAFGISAWDGPFEIKPTVEVYVATTVNDVDKTVTLTEDTVKAALGSQDGKVQTMQDFMDVLNYAFDQQGVGIIASQNFSNVVRYDPDTTMHPESGAKTNIGVRGAGDNLGTVANINFMDIDITTANNLDLFIDNVQSMLQRATDGAAVLGSLKTRADAQSDYNQKIMDYTQSGVSRLVDANMEEDSAKLQAQQTQQQLALQALTIANAAPQSIMTLFQ
jgi:flagellin